MKNEILNIKDKVINRIAILTVIFLTPAYILVAIRGFEFGWQSMIVFHTILYVFLIFLAFFRKRIRLSLKIIFLSSVYLFIAIVALVNFAFSAGHYYVIITIAILSILISRKYAIFTTLFLLIVYFLIGFGFMNHQLSPITDLNKLAHNPLHWTSTLVSIFSLIGIFIYAFGDIYRELLKAYEEIKTRDEKFQLLFEQANDAITLLKDGVFFDCNEKACEYFQLSKSELIGKTVQDVSPEFQSDGQESEEKAFNLVKVTLEGNPQRFEWQHKKANGEVFDVSISLNKIELQNEVYVQGILRDITDSIQQKKEVERTRNEYRDFIKYSYSGICKLELKKPMPIELSIEEQVVWLQNNAYVTECNDQYARVVDYENAIKLIGKPIRAIYRNDNDFKEIALVFIEKNYRWNNLETKETLRTGRELYTYNNLHPTIIDNKLYGFWIISIDISELKNTQKELEYHKENLEELVKRRTLDLQAATEEWKTTSEDLAEKNNIIAEQNTELQLTLKHLKETQAQLLQVEKMASLGTLTAGVSHEINNPLNYLSGTYYGFVNYFKKYGTNDEQTTNLLLSSTETAINRISAIVKGLNQFSRDNSNYDEDCDVHAIIENCLTVLYNQYKNKVDIKKDFCSQVNPILGNVGKLHQVFTNILGNSIQAIEGKGQITIKTLCDNNNIKIEISDTGCGINKENLSKITEPFFTTKPPGEGTGLGLSITYSIIKEHKGILNFKSEPLKGTKAIIKLPIKTK